MAEKELFTEGWEFCKFPFGTTYEETLGRGDDFAAVELPHDWQIYDTAFFYEDCSGWYRKKLFCKKREDMLYILRFEGVYMDSEIYVNGTKVMEWKYGYSTFEAEITEQLVDGWNEIFVGVHVRHPNSRWYSGAGIYRNVWLKRVHRAHFVSDGIYISTEEKDNGYEILVSAETENAAGMEVCCCIEDSKQSVVLRKNGETANFSFFIANARTWEPKHPNLYSACLRLYAGENRLEEEEVRFGCRTIEVDPKKGFLLNHKKRKLNGVCLHHDLGALGAAVKKDAIRRQLTLMKEMGANAIRTAHNMPAVELMELADEMGFLVVSEAFDCWEKPKNPYDYARFFPDWWKRDVASWVRRDRNHPSLAFWSIGNEIYDMHAGERGRELTGLLMAEVYRHDFRKNGLVTFGSNFMPWENTQNCADLVKIAGYNYSEKYYDAHHKAHPDWVIYGSETASTVQSRGIYHFPFRQSVLADIDEQCSALGNSTTSWGAKSPEACIIAERDHPYSMGQFLWSGMDYIGEPTPYHTKNSYLGQADTAGFPKDSYYIYRSEWTDRREKPVLHLFPYWDFNEGQTVDVRITSNAPVVELFRNGISMGKKAIDHEHGDTLTADYRIGYMPGDITAVVYDEAGEELLRETRESFGEPERITAQCLRADGTVYPEHLIRADGLRRRQEETAGLEQTGACGTLPAYRLELRTEKKELLFLEIGMEDSLGHPVENANNRVRVQVSGEGRLLGLDNGDSTDYDSYKGDSRRLFSGKLLAILETTGEEGLVCVHISEEAGNTEEAPWARKIELCCNGPRNLNPECGEAEIKVRVLPERASGQKLCYEIVSNAGIPSDLAQLQEIPISGEEREKGIAACLKVRAKGDGEFRLRVYTTNGAPQAKVISSYDFCTTGMGTLYFNPYRLVTGGLYNDSVGEIGNGNEHGVATARDGRSVVGFCGVDFGETGSDCITLPVFELGGVRTPIGIWDGKPEEEGSRLLLTAVYEKPSIWNTYQEETYMLPERLKGVHDLYFELHQKIHLKGFVFKEYPKAFEKLAANQSQSIYGDQLRVTKDGVMDIGNNVTLEFTDMDFGEKGMTGIRLYGRTRNEKNTIHIRFWDGEKENRQIIEFRHCDSFEVQEFSLERISGPKQVSFIFMPGSQFDFGWFQFI